MVQNQLMIRIAADVRAAEQSLAAIRNQIGGIGPAASRSANDIGKLSAVLSAMGNVTAIAYVGKQIYDLGITLRNSQLEAIRLGNTLKFALGGEQQGRDGLKYAADLANRLGLELNATAQGYAKFAAAATSSNMTLAQTNAIFEGVAKGATVMGLSAADANGVFLALSQMLSKGKVSAEELRGQLGERMPGAMAIAARSVGMTTEKFSEMLDKGQIISRDFLPKFAAEMSKTFGAAANDAANTAIGNVNRLSNAWEQFKQRMGTASDAAGITAPNWLTRALSEASAAMDQAIEKGEYLKALMLGIGGFEFGALGKGMFDKGNRSARIAEIYEEIDAIESLQRKLDKTGGTWDHGNTAIDKSMRNDKINKLKKEREYLWKFDSLDRSKLPKAEDVATTLASTKRPKTEPDKDAKKSAAKALQDRLKAENDIAFAHAAAAFDQEGIEEQRARDRIEADNAWRIEEERHTLDTLNEINRQAWDDKQAMLAGDDVTAAMEAANQRLASIRSRLDAEVTIGAKGQTAAQIELRQATGAVGNELAGNLIPRLQTLIASAPDETTREKWRAFYAEIQGMQATGKQVGAFEGMKAGLNDYSKSVEDTFATSRAATERAFKGMEDALVNFVKTGKLDFKSLSDSIISDLIRIQIQESITTPLSKAMGSFNLAGLFGFSEGGAPGGVSAWRNQVVSKPTFFAFANGGVMGEAGPEAIMPLTRKNGRLGVDASGAASGGNVTVNQTIQIDSRSDQSVIIAAMARAKNEAISAINQSLSRGGTTARLAGVV